MNPLYLKTFSTISDAIEALQSVVTALQQLQIEMEEVYISREVSTESHPFIRQTIKNNDRFQ